MVLRYLNVIKFKNNNKAAPSSDFPLQFQYLSGILNSHLKKVKKSQIFKNKGAISPLGKIKF